MRVVARIGAQGYFSADVLVGDDEQAPPDTVETRPAAGFHRPRWDGTAWIEGMASADLLAAAKARKRSEIAQAFVEACTVLYPEIQDVFAIWLAVPEYAASPNGERPRAIRANIARLQDRLGAVAATATVEEVRGIVW